MVCCLVDSLQYESSCERQKSLFELMSKGCWPYAMPTMGEIMGCKCYVHWFMLKAEVGESGGQTTNGYMLLHLTWHFRDKTWRMCLHSISKHSSNMITSRGKNQVNLNEMVLSSAASESLNRA